MQAVNEASRDIKAVAARLNATIAEEDQERLREGHADGVKWAREYATAAELRFVAEDVEPGRGSEITGADLPTLIAFMADKEGENVISARPTDAADGFYWFGFIEGASEVWTAVSPLLDA